VTDSLRASRRRRHLCALASPQRASSTPSSGRRLALRPCWPSSPSSSSSCSCNHRGLCRPTTARPSHLSTIMHLARGTTSKVADRRASSSILENRPFERLSTSPQTIARPRSRELPSSRFWIHSPSSFADYREEQVGGTRATCFGGKDRRLERDRGRALSTERLNGHRVKKVSFSRTPKFYSSKRCSSRLSRLITGAFDQHHNRSRRWLLRERLKLPRIYAILIKPSRRRYEIFIRAGRSPPVKVTGSLFPF